MMVKFTVAGFTKSEAVRQAMSKFHSKEIPNWYDMMNFQLPCCATNSAGISISFKAGKLDSIPDFTISARPSALPIEMLFASHIWSLFAKPITRGIGTFKKEI